MRTKKGIITSAKMDKTVVVTVARSVMHSKYRKRYPVSKKFMADTGTLKLHEGDTVVIAETKPQSKKKRYKVIEVITSPGSQETLSVEDDMNTFAKNDSKKKNDESSEITPPDES